MKKSFQLIKKVLGLGTLLVGLLFISNYLSSVHPVNNNFLSNHLDNITNHFVTPTYAFIAPSLPCPQAIAAHRHDERFYW